MSEPRQIEPSTMTLARPPHRIDHLRQHVDRAAAVVELAAAVVRHVDPFDAVLDRDAGVLGGGDALDGERDLELLLDALDRLPVERGLVDAVLHPPASGGDEALGDVALAPAVMGGVDREANAE